VNKQTIIEALRVFVNQRPGLEFGNYGEWKAYSAEVRSIGKDLREARQLLRAVELRDTITAEDIVKAASSAYSGRLSIVERDGMVAIDYCVGQYWPTEYRRAVCAVLSACLWAYWRETAPVDAGPIESHSNLQNVGGYIRNTAKREFGRGMASRWFN
jgi:hypothetical protein